jgi:hypothetical protein
MRPVVRILFFVLLLFMIFIISPIASFFVALLGVFLFKDFFEAIIGLSFIFYLIWPAYNENVALRILVISFLFIIILLVARLKDNFVFFKDNE